MGVGIEHPDSSTETRGAILAMNDAVKVEEGANILGLLVDSIKFDAFKSIFLEHYGRGIELNLGAPYLIPFVEALASEVSMIRQSGAQRESLLSLSRRLFDNGNKPLAISKSMTLTDFCDQYTGDNLRWETVGVILTFIGMAAIEAKIPTSIVTSDEERQRLRMQMVVAGDACISFCESFDNLNDVQIVLLFINCLLHSLFNGDQSFKTWRRLSDVTSSLFAFGLHEEIDENQGLPFFLVQLRKRIFARVYASDIAFAAFLGRPPRVSKRFCCAHMPLDMEEEAYYLQGEELAESLKDLDENGWNTKGQIRKSAVVRWSMITSQIREDLLELLLGRNSTNVPERIAQIRLEASEAWSKLPSFLKCSREELWNSDRPPRELDTLHVIRVLHLHNLFLIERAVTRHSRERSDACVSISSELLMWINDVIVRRERLSKVSLNGLSWKVIAYALPAAGVLALELLQQSRRKWANHLEIVPRTQVIQDLSVLVVHMDVLISPGDGNYQLFHQAKRALQSILDIILAPPEPQQLETPSAASSTGGFPLNDWVLYDQLGFDGDFWSSLADHPLLADADINHQLHSMANLNTMGDTYA